MLDVYVENDIEIALSKDKERKMLFYLEEQLINFMQNPTIGIITALNSPIILLKELIGPVKAINKLFNFFIQFCYYLLSDHEEMEISDKYHRKLAHSLAKRFFMDSKTQRVDKPKKSEYNQEPEVWKIVFWKTKKTKIPNLKLTDLVDVNIRNKDNNLYHSYSYEGNLNINHNPNQNYNNYHSDLNIK